MNISALIARFVGNVADAVPTVKLFAVSRATPETSRQWSPPEIDIVDGWDLPARMDGVLGEVWWRVTIYSGRKYVIPVTSAEGEKMRTDIVGVGRSSRQTL